MFARFAAGPAMLLLAACFSHAPEASIEAELEFVGSSLAEGRIEQAAEVVARCRARDPRHVDAAQWSALLADLLWHDDEAIQEQTLALRHARAAGADKAPLAALRGRLGDLLFQAGRWSECVGPLLAGAGAADAERRTAFATIALGLPFQRKPAGPLLTEQPLLPGDSPEIVCGAGGLRRPFTIDTGTSMTTVSRSFAEELGVRGRQAAGKALDAAGRPLQVEIGTLPQFAMGDVDLGPTPVLVVEDQALRLRDLYGGPERVPRGVLGLDLVAACRLTLDPERQSVVLELPRGLPADQSVQCVRLEGRCLVPVFVEGGRMWFVLDTGASHSSFTAVGLQALPGGDGRAVPSFRRVRTVGGSVVAVREVRDLVLRCSEARFRGVTLPVVQRASSALFPVHGVLGVDLLSHCRVTIDRGRARLIALP
ncbi:MAG TPA: pepsin/retropepsin-like aspartic protease family protein [Planctomycetota bacterium]|nr:pepsin/retropepsin-like aspartic protease family protein [Planctomycetota bacterium]